MKVSLEWAQHCSNVEITSIGVDEVVNKIGAQLGAVEEVVNWGAKYNGTVVAKVVECIKHPNADKLSLCKVDDNGVVSDVDRDENGYVQVVCGAPNVREGLLVAWIPPGAVVPSSYSDEKPFKLDARELRGKVSNGMIASASELAISDEHDGILEITEADAHPGQAFKELYNLDDYVIDLENKMFTHRPDCFGVMGVARELAGIQHKPFKSKDWYNLEATVDSGEGLNLDVKVDTDMVPRFLAITISDVKVAPSPIKMQVRLSKVGIRPINNIVDITNLLMYATGQPLHAYDYDKVVAKGGGSNAILRARLSSKGEKLSLLNGKEVELTDDTTVLICANQTPIGVGGIMGGTDTEVDESTKNIILECATFDMYNIRRTAMKYGLFTDAVTRFNKGQSPLQNQAIIAKASQMIKKLAGGSSASNLQDYTAQSVQPHKDVQVSAVFINDRLGASLTADDMASLLNNVEFEVLVNGDDMTVKVPFWRQDIELPEDVVEEVGRLYGFDKLPIKLPKKLAKAVERNELSVFKSKIRQVLVATGSNELLTYSFVHKNLLDKANQNIEQAYKLSNALSPELQYYRLSLLPSILDKVHSNVKNGYGEFAIFEIGKAHTKKWISEDGLPIEAERVAFVFCADEKSAKNYEGQAYYQAREFLDNLLEKLNVVADYQPISGFNPKIAESDPIKPFYQPRSAAVVFEEGEFIGTVGEFTSKITRGLKLPEYCAGFELDVKQLMNAVDSNTSYQQIPKYPKINQDLTISVTGDISFANVSGTINASAALHMPEDSLTSVKLIDIFKKDDRINYTFRLQVASYERTLIAKEVTEVLNKIANDAKNQLNAQKI